MTHREHNRTIGVLPRVVASQEQWTRGAVQKR